MSKEEQEARIALLQHDTSQMQSYRVDILAAVVVILTIVELWNGILPERRTLPLNLFTTGIVAAIIATIVCYAGKIVWYGQLTDSTRSAPLQTQNSSTPLLGRLDHDITTHAENKVKTKVATKADWVLKQLIIRGKHRPVNEWIRFWLPIFVVFWIVISVGMHAFGLGSAVHNVYEDGCFGISFNTILVQVPLVVATVLVAIATCLVFRATKQMANNVVRPFLVFRASTPDERKEHFISRNFPSAADEELRDFVSKKGITVENVGLGPAVNGTVTVTIEGKAMSSTFFRIYRSEPSGLFRYFYPSPLSPEIQIPEDAHEISVETQYYDIAEKHYPQKPQRLKI